MNHFIFGLRITLLGLLISTTAIASSDFKPDESCQDSVQKQHYDIALQQCEFESEKGDSLASEFLGFMYLKGKGGPRDWNLAKRFLEQSVDQGNVMANRYLAVMYWNGLGVPKDREKAKELFQKCVNYDKEKDIACTVQYAKTLSYNTNSIEDKRNALTLYQKLVDHEAYEYSYNYSKLALSLNKYNLAYRQSEFFLLWAQRYGNLAELRTKFRDAENISANAAKKISVEELSIGSSLIKAKIMDINRAFLNQKKLK